MGPQQLSALLAALLGVLVVLPSLTSCYPADLSSRSSPGVYICDKSSWEGNCTYIADIEVNHCYAVSNPPASSFGPDKGLKCRLYTVPHCSDDGIKSNWLEWPGTIYIGGLWTLAGHGSEMYVEGWMCNTNNDATASNDLGERKDIVPPNRNATLQSEILVTAKRDTPGVYICTGLSFTGTCVYHNTVEIETCFNANLSPSASFGPDPGLYCYMHTAPDCAGLASAAVTYPGETKIGDLWAFEDEPDFQGAPSWICYDQPWSPPPRSTVRDESRGTITTVGNENTAPGILVCSGSDWTGTCHSFGGIKPGVCYNLGLGPSESFAPDAGLSCMFWTAQDCSGLSSGQYWYLDITRVSIMFTKLGGNIGAASFICIDTRNSRHLELSLSKREELAGSLGVYICSAPNWAGVCQYESNVVTNGHCYVWMMGPDTSFGPDKGLQCTLHTGTDCGGQASHSIQWPGTAEIATEFTSADAQNAMSAESFKCLKSPSEKPINNDSTDTVLKRAASNIDTKLVLPSSVFEVYTCPDPDWKGKCTVHSNVAGDPTNPFVCQNKKLPDHASFGPGQGLFCNLFSAAGCAGSHTESITFPGYKDVSAETHKAGFQSALSWACSTMPIFLERRDPMVAEEDLDIDKRHEHQDRQTGTCLRHSHLDRPVRTDPDALAVRAVVGVWYCDSPDAGGCCTAVDPVVINKCYAATLTSDGSFYPETGITCHLWTKAGCTGKRSGAIIQCNGLGCHNPSQDRIGNAWKAAGLAGNTGAESWRCVSSPSKSSGKEGELTPKTDTTNDPAVRTAAGITICTKLYSRGECTYHNTIVDEMCYTETLPARGSFAPDVSLVCNVFSQANCGGDFSGPIEAGDLDSQNIPTAWAARGLADKVPLSWQCTSFEYRRNQGEEDVVAGTDINVLSKRDTEAATPGVYICTGSALSGTCHYVPSVVAEKCYPASLTSTASFGPEAGIICYLYPEASCGGQHSGPIDHPGNQKIGNAWTAIGLAGRGAASWKCT